MSTPHFGWDHCTEEEPKQAEAAVIENTWGQPSMQAEEKPQVKSELAPVGWGTPQPRQQEPRKPALEGSSGWGQQQESGGGWGQGSQLAQEPPASSSGWGQGSQTQTGGWGKEAQRALEPQGQELQAKSRSPAPKAPSPSQSPSPSGWHSAAELPVTDNGRPVGRFVPRHLDRREIARPPPASPSRAQFFEEEQPRGRDRSERPAYQTPAVQQQAPSSSLTPQQLKEKQMQRDEAAMAKMGLSMADFPSATSRLEVDLSRVSHGNPSRDARRGGHRNPGGDFNNEAGGNNETGWGQQQDSMNTAGGWGGQVGASGWGQGGQETQPQGGWGKEAQTQDWGQEAPIQGGWGQDSQSAQGGGGWGPDASSQPAQVSQGSANGWGQQEAEGGWGNQAQGWGQQEHAKQETGAGEWQTVQKSSRSPPRNPQRSPQRNSSRPARGSQSPNRSHSASRRPLPEPSQLAPGPGGHYARLREGEGRVCGERARPVVTPGSTRSVDTASVKADLQAEVYGWGHFDGGSISEEHMPDLHQLRQKELKELKESADAEYSRQVKLTKQRGSLGAEDARLQLIKETLDVEFSRLSKGAKEAKLVAERVAKGYNQHVECADVDAEIAQIKAIGLYEHARLLVLQAEKDSSRGEAKTTMDSKTLIDSKPAEVAKAGWSIDNAPAYRYDNPQQAVLTTPGSSASWMVCPNCHHGFTPSPAPGMRQ